MNYVKESIERVVALESCDGRYTVNMRGCEPGDDLWKQRVKQMGEYEETVRCKAYYCLTRERKVLRLLTLGSCEREAPGYDDLCRFIQLANTMLDDCRDDSSFYVFRPERSEDITDLCYLADMTDDSWKFSETECPKDGYHAGGADLRTGRVYVLRVRWGELGESNGDTCLECYDAEKFVSCAKELMDGMAGYLDGAFGKKAEDTDKKEADDGTDKQ